MPEHPGLSSGSRYPFWVRDSVRPLERRICPSRIHTSLLCPEASPTKPARLSERRTDPFHRVATPNGTGHDHLGVASAEIENKSLARVDEA
jgi:hypothetical protein